MAVAHRLHVHESDVEHQRHRRDEPELARRIRGSGRRGGVVGQHQREHGERRDGRERRAHAMPREGLLVVLPGAGEQAEPHHARDDDHDRGVHGIARQRHVRRGVGEHQRDDERHLDDGDGDREHQGAERLADALGDDLGVVHSGEHRAHQGDDHRYPEPGQRYGAERRDRHQQRDRRPDPGPAPRATCGRGAHDDGLIPSRSPGRPCAPKNRPRRWWPCRRRR